MTTNGRDARGRFAKGYPGGPGRPPRARETRYLLTLSEACPPETWDAICHKAVEQARAGDKDARTWLSQFLIGRTTLDGAIDDIELKEDIAAILAEVE